MKVMSTLLAAIAAIASISGTAQATAIFTAGNNPQSGEENVLFGNQQTGTTITGATNQSNTPVQFVSTQTLETGGVGQAFLQAPGENTAVITGNVTFSVPGHTFSDYIFNAQVGGPAATGGPATIRAVTNDFIFDEPITLGNGNNFWTVTTTDNEVLLSVTLFLTAGTSYQQYQQPRVSGISGVTPVPEPASLALLSSALVGFGLLRRRKA